ncbi:MAG: hypothetical protein CVV49_06970 [Spirochaetae bacterium HGW-Spirochaetae-5]|nr:MAG: hypothetical protein CVV49_06970 [Spirochaetae bacterium HGW-Spirochaetae-5]
MFPGDETFYNPLPAEGTEITTLTATVSNDLTATNPVIRITFNTPVDDFTILYDTTIQVESPIGNVLTEGAIAGQYNAFPDTPLTSETSIIIIDLNNIPHTSGTVIRVTLTSGLIAYTNPSVTLSNPGNFDRTIP